MSIQVWIYVMYHDSISKTLDANVGDGGSGELQGAQVADEYLSDEAEQEVENGHDNRGSGELPEEPRLPNCQFRPPTGYRR